MLTTRSFRLAVVLLGLTGIACSNAVDDGKASEQQETSVQNALEISVGKSSLSVEYASFYAPPAGVAGGKTVVFVGSPLEGKVNVLSRFSGQPVGELPPPEGGFILPFVLHSTGSHRVTLLDAGGLPSPDPFYPANPTLYEYDYGWHAGQFSATLKKSISFQDATIGFAEDFVKLADGRYVVSDALLGGIWTADPDGTVHPGIVPARDAPEDAIPEITICDSMPLIQVGGVPFLFAGATLPGVSPLEARFGKLYFYSPCAAGLYSVPLSVLSDNRAPYERAADIQLVSPKPANIEVEQLLALTFDPRPNSPWVYAADSLQLQVIRINVLTGKREVVASDPTLFNFPSTMAFLPPVFGVSPLVVVSNQQHLLTLTNYAIDTDMPHLPFLATKVFIKQHPHFH